MRATILLCGMLLSPARAQETRQESELTTAIAATVSRGFAYAARPVANIPDGFPQDRLALAGAPISGTYADGVYHARDGSYEIYRKDSQTAIRTERGWLPLQQFTAPLRQDVAHAFDDQDGKLWKRGNVTAGRKSLLQLIQISHLEHRTNVDRLHRVGTAFTDLKTVETNRQGVVLEGDLTETAAFGLLQGPFAALVERGTLSFRNLSGVGRISIDNGLVRRIHLKAGGAYSYFQEADNVRRRGVCALEVTVELTKHGETKVELPKEVAQLFKASK